jgi:hypothetical protein
LSLDHSIAKGIPLISQRLSSGLRWGLPLLILIFLVRASNHFDYTPDDTFIYLQFAKNVVAHHEISFNAGEPAYGTTSPLWLLAISTFRLLGADPLVSTKIFDLVLAGCSVVTIFYVMRALGGNDVYSLLAAGLLSCQAWFVRWAGSGMETSLAVLLSSLFLLFLLKRRFFLLALTAGLLLLTRPEAAIPIALSSLSATFVDWRSGEAMRGWLWFAVGVVAVVLPWEVLALLHFGSIVPTTALAKSGFEFSVGDMYATAVDLAQTMAVSDGGMVLLGIVSYVLIRRSGHAGVVTGSVPLIAWCVGLPIYYVLTSTNVVSRYTLVTTPAFIVLSVQLAARAVEVQSFGVATRRFLIAGALVPLVLNSVLFEWMVKPQMELFATSMKSGFVAFGEWLRQNTPENTAVLVGDVGAIGYYSERKIYDAAGLVTPEFIPLARNGYNVGLFQHESDYRRLRPADYVIIPTSVRDPRWPPHLKPVFTRPMFGLRMTSKVPTYYTLLKVIDAR